MTETNPKPEADGYLRILMDCCPEEIVKFEDVEGYTDNSPNGLFIKYPTYLRMIPWHNILDLKIHFNTETYELAYHEWQAKCEHVWKEPFNSTAGLAHTCITCDLSEVIKDDSPHYP